MDYELDPGLTWPAPRTFFGAPRCEDPHDLDAQVAFIGVPYDAGTLQPYIRTGQSGGPALARHSSWNQLDFAWPPSAPTDGSAGWFDIVELDAPHDISQATARVTTWLMVHFMSSIFDQR